MSFFFFLFQNRFFFKKKTILYDPHAKGRIVVGRIYFKYQRSIFTYCILESSRAEMRSCGRLSRGAGHGRPCCLGFLFDHVPFLNYASTGKTQ